MNTIINNHTVAAPQRDPHTAPLSASVSSLIGGIQWALLSDAKFTAKFFLTDRNGNGSWSMEEWRKSNWGSVADFRIADRNHDGGVTRSEAAAWQALHDAQAIQAKTPGKVVPR